ncbi:MAG: hypothetical protein HY905_17650 [Deltaproteobacteria bacterium]|nr:hypothetical protein [Deltaproteobacteria bacterium]
MRGNGTRWSLVAALIAGVVAVAIAGAAGCDDGGAGGVEAATYNYCWCTMSEGSTTARTEDVQLCAEGLVPRFQEEGYSPACLRCMANAPCSRFGEACEVFCH